MTKILVIDDEPSITNLVSAYLKPEGYEVYTAADGNAGLKAARARGKMGGRPPLLDTRQINRMIEMYNEQKNTVAEICKIYSISRPAFYNYLNNRRRELAKNNSD